MDHISFWKGNVTQARAPAGPARHFARRPSILTGNPYARPAVGRTCGPALWISRSQLKGKKQIKAFRKLDSQSVVHAWARSPRTAAHPLHARLAQRIGTSVSEATIIGDGTRPPGLAGPRCRFALPRIHFRPDSLR